MTDLLITVAVGLVIGLIASAIMEAFQALAAKPFGQTAGNEDPATVKAADSVSEPIVGRPVTQKYRAGVGRLVHYVTGAALGVLYIAMVAIWPPAGYGFGTAFGLVTAIVLDVFVVPAFGWGSPAWKTPLNTHAYGLASHFVFGAALEGARRGAFLLLGGI